MHQLLYHFVLGTFWKHLRDHSHISNFFLSICCCKKWGIVPRNISHIVSTEQKKITKIEKKVTSFVILLFGISILEMRDDALTIVVKSLLFTANIDEQLIADAARRDILLRTALWFAFQQNCFFSFLLYISSHAKESAVCQQQFVYIHNQQPNRLSQDLTNTREKNAFKNNLPLYSKLSYKSKMDESLSATHCRLTIKSVCEITFIPNALSLKYPVKKTNCPRVGGFPAQVHWDTGSNFCCCCCYYIPHITDRDIFHYTLGNKFFT